MITLGDVLFKIAQRMHGYSGYDKSAAIEEFVSGYAHDLHIAITTDVEETEECFLRCYGQGQTFYFRLADYEHGKSLAGQLYWTLLGRKPDMSTHTGACFSPDDRLYLVIFAHDVKAPKRPLITAGGGQAAITI